MRASGRLSDGRASARILRDQLPVFAGVGGLEEADHAGGARRIRGRRTGDRGVEHLRIARRERDVRLNYARQAFSELLPGGAAVGGLVDAVARAAEPLPFDEALLLLPQRGVHGARRPSARCERRCRWYNHP